MTTEKLSSENVNSTFLKCLFKDGENAKDYKEGQGLRMRIGFNPERLKENEILITEMLNELPDSFKKSGGGGMSFLNMCEDKNGNQWTSLHSIMEQLVCLGNAIGKLSFPMPKEMWNVLPGGVPYLRIEL